MSIYRTGLQEAKEKLRRAMSSKQPPSERANEIIESVPSSNIVTKTGAVILGTGLTATAISQELYVVNEETVVLAGFLILATFIARVCIAHQT